jgi:amino acid transporter
VTALAESVPLALMLAVFAVLFVGLVLYKLARRFPRRGRKRPADRKG